MAWLSKRDNTEGGAALYYPEETVEEVRMKNDIVDVISGKQLFRPVSFPQ